MFRKDEGGEGSSQGSRSLVTTPPPPLSFGSITTQDKIPREGVLRGTLGNGRTFPPIERKMFYASYELRVGDFVPDEVTRFSCAVRTQITGVKFLVVLLRFKGNSEISRNSRVQRPTYLPGLASHTISSICPKRLCLSIVILRK